MKARPPKNKRLLAAQAAHAKFLRAYGIDPDRPAQLRGVDLPSRHVKTGPPLSDTVPPNGPKVTPRGDNLGLVVGQPYHKGPLMVLSSKDDLKTNKRRDR